MASVVNTYIYKHYQIVITEDYRNQFFYAINNPYSNNTVYKPMAVWMAAVDAQNAAQAQVELLPANTAEPFIAAVEGVGDTLAGQIIDTLLMNKYIIEVAQPRHEDIFVQDWD